MMNSLAIDLICSRRHSVAISEAKKGNIDNKSKAERERKKTENIRLMKKK